MIRLFVDAPIILTQAFILKDASFNHAIRVLRLTVGEEITLFNGLGGEYQSRIIEIQKKQAILEIVAFNEINRESSLKIHLYQSLAKGDKMDLVLQKATELGVDEITLLNTERSIANLSMDRFDKKMMHYNAVVASACEQCGRNIIPRVNSPLKLSLLMPVPEQLYITLDPYAMLSLTDCIRDFKINRPSYSSQISLIVGPEGGLSNQEINQLISKGCKNIRLGARILRTETVGIAVIGALQALLGDW